MEMTPAMNEKLRLQAYYYGFSETGVRSIDLVLRAVSMAGKLFHHTDQWTSEIDYPIENVRGSSPVDWIQNAADDAAATLATVKRERELLRKEVRRLEQWLITRIVLCDSKNESAAQLVVSANRSPEVRALVGTTADIKDT